MKRILAGMASVIAALSLLVPSAAAEAASRAAIVEYTVVGQMLTAYVKGAGEPSSVKANIGKATASDASFRKLSESGIPMKTLVLIDNSLSIPQNSRKQAVDQVMGILNARRSGESFAIGTVSKEISILQDFTDDYITLKACVDNLKYENQKTDITDALYKYLDPRPFGSEAAFTRILLVSDGEAYEDVGYTNEELAALLKSNPVTIYCVGIRNGYNNNAKDLENMFAWSRLTGGSTFMLNELQNKDDLAAAMAEDWNNTVVTLTIPEDECDGGQKTLTLALETAEGSRTLSLDGVRVPTIEATPTPAPTPAPTPEPTPEPEPEPEPDHTLLYILIGVGVLVVAGIVAAVVLLRKKGGEKKTFDTMPRDELDNKFQSETGSTVMVGGSGTEMVGEGTEMVDGDGTLIDLWGEKTPISNILLTDVNDMRFRMKKSITSNSALVVGRNTDCDVCVNYDKTVSGRHCEIIKEVDGYYINNLSSSNGTIVNGTRITGRTPVHTGDLIKMGKVELRLEIEE